MRRRRFDWLRQRSANDADRRSDRIDRALDEAQRPIAGWRRRRGRRRGFRRGDRDRLGRSGSRTAGDRPRRLLRLRNFHARRGLRRGVVSAAAVGGSETGADGATACEGAGVTAFGGATAALAATPAPRERRSEPPRSSAEAQALAQRRRRREQESTSPSASYLQRPLAQRSPRSRIGFLRRGPTPLPSTRPQPVRAQVSRCRRAPTHWPVAAQARRLGVAFPRCREPALRRRERPKAAPWPAPDPRSDRRRSTDPKPTSTRRAR